MEEMDRHPAAIIKEILVIAKALFAMYGLLKAAKIWGSTKAALAKPACALLALNAFLVGMVTVYKFTSKDVAPLFLLQGLSHYSVFLIFVVLVKYGDYSGKAQVKAKLAKPFMGLHVAYAVVLAVGYKLCKCSAETPYPISFVMSDCLFFAVYYILWQLKKRGINVESSTKEGQVFAAQIEAYFGQYSFLVKWHLLELVLGRVLFETLLDGAVYCTEDGDKWLYRSGAGVLFTILHILGTMQGLGATKNVFVSSVKKVIAPNKEKKEN